MRQKWFRMTLAAAAVCFAVTAETQAAGIVKIGVNQPLTGAVAASGNFVTNGAKIAADEINTKGGINGSKIELVIEDNKSNPTEAANAAEKLIVRDKVPVMLGAWSSTYTLAAMPKLMEYKVPMVVETSGADKITTSGNPYVFRICPTNGMEALSFARHVAALNIRKADMLVVNNDWGRGSADAFQAMLKEKGVTVGRVLTMDASAQDMTSQLSTLKGTDSDTLFVTTAVEQLTLVLKQAQSLGLKRRIITLGGSQSPNQLIEHAGSAANGSMHNMMFAPWFPEASADPVAAKAFIAEWNKRGYDGAGLTEGFRGYDGIRTIVAAIAKAGSPDPEKIRDALWKTELTGLTGKIAFSKAGPLGKESGQSTPNTYLVKIENGKVELVP
ncbi:ABC transporter substrate-binding protein [Undibacterium arcticum]|uniref:ABC transporter substrate-binding protein n=1 Tax=Undibacterium arcticum TaxID=1762892 RepID=A0ABV7EY02_9BURK